VTAPEMAMEDTDTTAVFHYSKLKFRACGAGGFVAAAKMGYLK
jgi:hypothetical protein